MCFRVSSPVPRQTGRAVAVIQRKSSSKSLRAQEARLESRGKLNAAVLSPYGSDGLACLALPRKTALPRGS